MVPTLAPDYFCERSQIVSQRQATQVEPYRFLGMRRQRKVSKETKAASWRNRVLGKRELQRDTILEICRVPFKYSAEHLSTHIYEEGSYPWLGKE